MRYLNYLCYGNVELTLKYPEDLVSLSIECAKLSNMNKCINLRNLYSAEYRYESDEIAHLRKLCRICSDSDVYRQNGSCFLQDVFWNKKLEYVYVDNRYSDSNVIKSLTINENI